jgi:hypothetical protein
MGMDEVRASYAFKILTASLGDNASTLKHMAGVRMSSIRRDRESQ